jgi:hypothetical protein
MEGDDLPVAVALLVELGEIPPLFRPASSEIAHPVDLAMDDSNLADASRSEDIGAIIVEMQGNRFPHRDCILLAKGRHPRNENHDVVRPDLFQRREIAGSVSIVPSRLQLVEDGVLRGFPGADSCREQGPNEKSDRDVLGHMSIPGIGVRE